MENNLKHFNYSPLSQQNLCIRCAHYNVDRSCSLFNDKVNPVGGCDLFLDYHKDGQIKFDETTKSWFVLDRENNKITRFTTKLDAYIAAYQHGHLTDLRFPQVPCPQDSNPIILGDLIPQSEYDEISNITEEDIRVALNDWRESAPDLYKKILDSD